MSRSLKAALLSALVFPGVGQLFLGLRTRALLFLVPAALAAGYFAVTVYRRVDLIMDDIAMGRLAIDPIAIATRLEQTRDPGMLTDLAVAVMLICWIASTLDAWFLTPREN